MAIDYSETKACLQRARAALQEAHQATGRTNLPPTARVSAIRTQIDALEEIVREASEEIAAAREACLREGRQRLSLV